MLAPLEKIKSTHIEAICDFLGDTTEGLTGSEIGKLFMRLGIQDVDPLMTKRIRIFGALDARQNSDNCSNKIIEFIQEAMDPVSYVGSRDFYEKRRAELNGILSFAGYFLTEEGKVTVVEKANNLTDSEKRANRLKFILKERNVHHDVLRFCSSELLDSNYFHAVFEATKSIADKIRDMTGLGGDGANLVEEAFSLGKRGMPFLALNMLTNDSEKSEQKGFVNLLKGLFGVFRNTTGHAPKIKWEINEHDALDLLTMASYVHRRLDKIHKTPLCK